MRNDLYVGALIALGVHTTLASISSPKRPPRPVKADDTIIVCTFPVYPEPIPPELPAETGDICDVKETSVTAPQLPDLPRPVATGAFTMPPTVISEGAPIDSKIPIIPIERGEPKKGGPGVVDLTLLDRAPLARFQAQPNYPFEMKRGGISGEVLVEFIVDANGAVREARAVRSSQREFESAAVQAVSKWTFRPGQKDGRNVATRMQVPIVFRLNESSE